MATIVTRAGKGSPLTHTEVDANFTNLNTDKLEIGDSPSFAALTVGAVNYPDAGPLSSRNKIINGAMVIDQRNGGSAVTINSTSNVYTLDRWAASGQLSDGVYTVEQTTDAPAGFTNSLRVAVTTADASIGATQVYLLQHFVEGFNAADFDFGKSSAKDVTLSFWVRSSLTGTFGGTLGNSANDRAYPFTYSISSASTWEYKTITVPGDTTGTWLTNSGRGLAVRFQIGVGSSRVAAAGSWTGTSSIFGATGATNIIETLSATWDITGVQLEAGETATPFEHRSYGQELRLCQRYFYTADSRSIGTTVTAVSSTSGVIIWPVTMRAAPSISGGSFTVGSGSSGTFAAAATSNEVSSLFNSAGNWTIGTGVLVSLDASAEL